MNYLIVYDLSNWAANPLLLSISDHITELSSIQKISKFALQRDAHYRVSCYNLDTHIACQYSQNISNSMKLCFVHKDIANVERGGISTLYKNLVRGIKQVTQETQIFVVTQQDLTLDGITVIKAPLEPDKLLHSQNVERMIAEIDPDVVECSTWGYELLAYSRQIDRKAKIVVRVEPAAETLFDSMKFHDYEKELVNNADLLIAVSEFAKKDCSEKYSLSKDIIVVHNCIDIGQIVGIQTQPALTSGFAKQNGIWEQIVNLPINQIVKDNKVNIFWVGKQTKMKGFDILEDVVKQSPSNFNFIVNLGWSDEFVKWDEDCTDKCVLLKGLERDQQVSLWRQADVFLNTSIMEGFGLVVLESAINRVPIIANSVCKVYKEYFDSSWGLLESFDTISKVVKQIATISKSDFKFQNLEKFDISQYARENLKHYKQIV